MPGGIKADIRGLYPFFLVGASIQGVSILVNATQRTILFLIADTGAGHRSAANAISNAINIIAQREQEQWQLQHVQNTEAQQGAEGVAGPPPVYRIEIVAFFEEYI